MRINTSKIHDRIYELRQKLIEAEEKKEAETSGSPAYNFARGKVIVLRNQIEFLENLIS